jgi:hypothetical protein
MKINFMSFNNIFFIVPWNKYLLMIFILLYLLNSECHSDYLDSNKVFISIISVTHLNDGGSLDTVVGFASNTRKFLPKQILWGKDTTDNGIPDSLKVQKTIIEYPEWLYISGACSIDDFNNDTMTDILLVIWGKLQVDSLNLKDTSTSITIFGRRGLDTINNINITSLDSFQTSPVSSIKMRIGKEFTESRIRDLSYRPSYVLEDIHVQDTSSNPPRIPAEQENDDIQCIKVYPNPAQNLVNIEITKQKPGLYEIKFFSVEGFQLYDYCRKVTTNKDLRETINIESLSSGLYFVRIDRNKEMIGIFKLIIIR